MRWKDIPLVYKLSIGFGIIFIVFGFYAWYNFTDIKNIRSASNLLIRGNEYRDTLLKAENAHHVWAASVASYLLDDTITELHVVTDGHQCAFGKWYYGDERKKLEARMPDVVPILRDLEQPHLSLHASVPVIKAAQESGDSVAAQKAYREGVSRNLDLIRTGLTKTLGVVDARIQHSSAFLQDTFETSLQVSLLMSVGVLLICVGLAAFLGQSIAGPLRRLVLYAQDVAGGDLRQPRIVQKDEVGQLSKALGVMVGTLKTKIDEARQQTDAALRKGKEAEEALRAAETSAKEAAAKNATILDATQKIENVVNNATHASSDLSKQITRSKKGTEVQARRISRTVAAMEQMNGAVVEVTQNANTAAELSATARQKAEEGASVVEEVVKSILTVREQSRLLKEDMQTLGQHAQAVNRIMNVISDIADQTNLLALNAAIEAARAGEAGRGFAVVADEVRKLAEKTMASTTDVDNAIKAIQTSAEKNMHQVDEAVSTIEQTTELANKSGAALREIVSMVDGAAAQVRSIATASEQQAASSQEITDSINEVNTVAEQTAGAMQEAEKAVMGLAEQTQRLNTLVANLRGKRG